MAIENSLVPPAAEMDAPAASSAQDPTKQDDQELPLFRRPDEDIVKQIRQWFRESSDAYSETRIKRREDWKMLDGEQWDEAAKKLMTAGGRPALTLNQLTTIIAAVEGEERSNRQEIKLYGEGQEDDGAAYGLNRLLTWINHQCGGEFALSAQFRNGTVCGEAWIVPEVDYFEDPEGKIRLEHVDDEECFPDPLDMSPTASKSRYFHRVRMMTEEELDARWKGASDNIRQACFANDAGPETDGKGFRDIYLAPDDTKSPKIYDAQKKLWAVLESWWVQIEQGWVVVDEATGLLVEKTEDEFQVMKAKREEEQQGFIRGLMTGDFSGQAAAAAPTPAAPANPPGDSIPFTAPDPTDPLVTDAPGAPPLGAPPSAPPAPPQAPLFQRLLQRLRGGAATPGGPPPPGTPVAPGPGAGPAPMNIPAPAPQMPPALQAVQRPMKRVYQAFTCYDVLLDKRASPLKELKRQPYVRYGALFQKSKKEWKGLIRDLIDAQKQHNVEQSVIVQLMQLMPKAAWMAPKGAYHNKAEWSEKMAKPGAMLEYNASRGKPEQIETPALPRHLIDMASLRPQSMREISGVNIEMTGQRQGADPGVVFQMRKKAAATVLEPLFDNYRESKIETGKVLLSYIQTYISNGRRIRVLGPQGAQYVTMTEQMQIARYDVSIDEENATINDREATLNIMQTTLPMVLKAGIPVPPSFIDLLPMPPHIRDDWKRMVSWHLQITGQMPPPGWQPGMPAPGSMPAPAGAPPMAPPPGAPVAAPPAAAAPAHHFPPPPVH